MHFYAGIVAALAATVAAVPIELLQTRATCSALTAKPVTVAGKSVQLTGPFRLTAVGDFAKSGIYSRGSPGQFITYDVGPNKKDQATDWYLDSTGHLVSIANDKLNIAYEYKPEDYRHVALGTSANSAQLKCKLNKGACTLACTANGMSYNCLASAGFRPDWRIATEKAGAGPGCVPFVATVIPPS